MTRCHSAGGQLDQRLAKLDARVVDENVDRDAVGIEPGERGDDRGFIGDVEAGLVNGVAVSAHLGRGCGQPSRVGAVEDNRGTGRGEPLRHGPAETARGAGDQGRVAGEIEQLFGHRRLLTPPNAAR